METYLHVKLQVERDKVIEFVESAKKFLGTNFLQDKGWTFLLGFQVEEASLIDDLTRKPVHTPAGKDLVHFINVWRLPVDVDVATVMVELSELASYVNLDNLVTQEEQDIVFRINAPASQTEDQFTAALKSGATFAMVRHYIFREDLAKFALSSAALAPRLEELTKYAYAGCYQNITGLLNEFWDVWKIADGGKHIDGNATHAKGVREKLQRGITDATGLLADSYKQAIYFNESSLPRVNPAAAAEGPKADGPDDGIIVVQAAPYWK